MGQALSTDGKMEWWTPICSEIAYTVMSGDRLKQKSCDHKIKEIIAITMQSLISWSYSTNATKLITN